MRFKILNLIILYDFKIFRGANIKIYSLETKIHISLINSYAPQYIAFFCLPSRGTNEVRDEHTST